MSKKQPQSEQSPKFIAEPTTDEIQKARRAMRQELARHGVEPDPVAGFEPWYRRLRIVEDGAPYVAFTDADGKPAVLPLAEGMKLLTSPENPETVRYEARMREATLDALWRADISRRRDAALAAFAEEEKQGRPASFIADLDAAPGWIAIDSTHNRILCLPAVPGFESVAVPPMGQVIVARAYFEKITASRVWSAWFAPGLLKVGRAVYSDPTPPKPAPAPVLDEPSPDDLRWAKIKLQQAEHFESLGTFTSGTPTDEAPGAA